MFSSVSLAVLQSQFFDACLAIGTFLPACLGCFVATNVDVFRREDFHHLGQYCLQESECFLLAGAEHIFEDAPLAGYLIRTTGAA